MIHHPLPHRIAGRMASAVSALLLPLAFSVASASGRQVNRQAPSVVVLHEAVGPVIDHEENRRFALVEAPGQILAARLYQLRPGKFSMHVLGAVDGRGYMAIQSLGVKDKLALEVRIKSRLAAATSSELRPVIQIHLPDDMGPEELSVLILHDRTELQGKVVRVTADTVVFETAGGLMVAIPEEKVSSVDWPEGFLRGGQFTRYDPNSTRLFLAPTGRGLRQGEGYFADYILIFPTIAIGISDYVAMSGGISLIPGLDSQVGYLAPKVSLYSDDQVAAAAGLLFIFDLGGEGSIGVGYGVLSFGSPAAGVTLGAGIPFGEHLDTSPLLLVGGEAQVSSHAKLITENWIFTGGDPDIIFSAGVRFFGRKLAVDLALLSTPEAFRAEGFPFYPWVDFSVLFGR